MTPGPREEEAAALSVAGQAAGVRIEGVNLSYGSNHVLKDVELEIRPGEFFAFLGPSGCGKTTLLRLIAGFNQADTGRVLVGGRDISALPPWKRDIGMVFQSYALWPHLSVRQNVAFGLEERRLPRAEIAARVEQALGLVGLAHLADRRPAALSGGQQQRVAVARTIAIRPRLLLLDEPLSNLDAKLRVQVRRELRDLQRSLGMTAIFVTHDQEEANTVCDRIAVFREGSVQQVDTPMALYARPANLFVAGFLGSANILAGTPREGRFAVEGGPALPLPAGLRPPPGARLMFRPQDASLAPPRPDSLLTGTVAHREFLGPVLRYGVRVGEAEVLVDMPFSGVPRLHEVGDTVAITVDLGSAHWLTE
ncbi:ABC transporter ATP-binding protein [Roseomonas sp. KE0001]|uniref:ABC transporter ATP-binding protein n=1 Tax=unclassified Roseomonas TaxID=2617492 RepID=UPI0018DF23CB|nr:ABC transporter ATP-binding protein [Roseomonas sp. KE0001]MBI0433345.1 ABC transporter ATP-binding protein [Roseomonas sp. KE0001]